MNKLINKIYTENKDKKITKKETKDLILLLNKKVEMDKDEIEKVYKKSGLSGLLFLGELKKFELNLNNI